MNSLKNDVKNFNKASVNAENGNEYTVGDIIIYNKEGKILEVEVSRFEYAEDIKFLGIVYLKRNENFNIKCNYLKKDTQVWWDSRYNLYIYEENIDYKFVGYSKEGIYIFKDYEICGCPISIYYKNVGDKLYLYNSKIQDIVKHIENYCTLEFFDKEELENMLQEIKKYNELGLEEKKRIENLKVENEVF